MSRRRRTPPPPRDEAAVVLCGAAEPPEGRDRVPVVACAFRRDAGAPSVRCQNAADRVLRDLVADGVGAFVEGDPGEAQARADGWVPLWEVEVAVVADTRERVVVDVRYRRLPGCDNDSARAMMRLYDGIGRALAARCSRRVPS